MDRIFSYRAPENAPGPAADRGKGALRDLRIAIQPGMSVRGWPTEAGSNALAGFQALEDSTVVRRLREAGATICGSTRMSEFGLGLEGSSAGAAVRERVADVEMVMDFMGESRLAAWRANACGFKPSYGLVSRLGLVGLIPSMECAGIVSESVGSIRTTLEAIAGQDRLDFSLPAEDTPDLSPQTVEPATTTLGVMTEAESVLSHEQRETFRASLERLKSLGFSLRELPMPDFALFSLVHTIVGSVEASSAAGRYDSVRYGPRAPGTKNWNEMYLLSRGAAFGTLVKSYLIQGAFFQFEHYGAFEDACRTRRRLVDEMQALMSEVDFLALPASGAPAAGPGAGGGGVNSGATAGRGAAPSLDDLYNEFASTLFANLTGQPALCLPAAAGTGAGASSPPGPAAAVVGLQLVGPRLSDARVLALGALLLSKAGGGE